MSAKVRIAGTENVFDAPAGEDLLEVLQSNDYPIATSCGGIASCGLCRVTIVRGNALLSPIKPDEITHLGNVAKVIGMRLTCQAKIEGVGEIVLSVPPLDNVEDRKRRKADRLRRQRHDRQDHLARPAPSSSGLIEWRPRVLSPTSGKDEK